MAIRSWSSKRSIKMTPTTEQTDKIKAVSMPLTSVGIDDVATGSHRHLDDEVVASLKKSMAEIGLKTPITIKIVKRGIEPDGPFVTEHILVAGRHRLAAAKQLGWRYIDAFVHEGDNTDSELWEIGENLQRKELSALERDMAISKWAELLSKRNGQVVQSAEGEAVRGTVAEAARLLPLSGKTEGARRKIVERAAKVNAIAPEAKEAATAAGLADNRRALLKIAEAPSSAAQLQKVAELKRAKTVARAHTKKSSNKKYLKSVIRYPAARKDEVIAKLRKFVKELDIELVDSK
jgi:ParB/RepB/Spo0J family partition protein